MNDSQKPEATTLNQARDTGLALAFGLLLAFRAWRQDGLLLLAMSVLALAMLWPALFRLPARLWFGLAERMGIISSTVLLSLVFAFVLLPVALARKLAGADPMQRKLWRKGTGSVFAEREHTFSASDLEQPY